MRNPIQVATVIGIATLLLYITNLVVYEGLALVLRLTATSQLLTLGIALGALAAGFIGMMILGSYYYNLFTRVTYTLLATWMGTFGNLFFASIALGLVALFVPSDLLYQVSTGIYCLALLVSVYGVWHAKQIKVAKYSIQLPHLPEEWRGKRAAWISDLHLGQLHGPKFAAKVTAAVNAQKPDIIFIGGDLYDGTQAPSPSMLAEPLRALSAPWGVYYITGNHEEFGDNTAFVKAIKALGISVLFDQKADIHGLQLVGVDYHNANDAGRFSEILSAQHIDRSKPSILLKHEPNNLAIAEKAGISLQISGHTHYGQQWPFGLFAQLSYQGYAYGLKDFKNMQQLTSSGIGTWGPPLRVGSNAEMAVVTFV